MVRHTAGVTHVPQPGHAAVQQRVLIDREGRYIDARQ